MSISPSGLYFEDDLVGRNWVKNTWVPTVLFLRNTWESEIISIRFKLKMSKTLFLVSYILPEPYHFPPRGKSISSPLEPEWDFVTALLDKTWQKRTVWQGLVHKGRYRFYPTLPQYCCPWNQSLLCEKYPTAHVKMNWGL